MAWEDLRSAYLSVLSDEGFRPEVDEDGHIVFKYEGGSYIITSDCDEQYFSLLFPAFWETEENDEQVTASLAVIEATRLAKAAKVWMDLDEGVAVFSTESCAMVADPSDVRQLIVRLLRCIQHAVSEFNKVMETGGDDLFPSAGECQINIICESDGFPMGKSILRNIVGATSLANWKFIGRITGGGLAVPADIYEGQFQMDYGRPVETATGIDREVAEGTLKKVHQLILADGWRPASPGPHWYSYRYTADASILDRI